MNGMIAPADSSQNLLFGTFTFLPGQSYTVKVWTSSPNGFPDAALSNDTVVLNVLLPEPPQLGNDTLICNGTQILLDPGIAFSNYQWNDNSIDSTLSVSATGNYTVTTTDSTGCLWSDTIRIEVPVADLGSDTTSCIGAPLTLLFDTTGFTSFVWSTGSTQPFITVNTTNTYAVSAIAGTCIESDTIVVTFQPGPVVNLGADTLVCGNDLPTLDAGGGFTSYLWSTGGTQQTIMAIPLLNGDTAAYSVTVTNQFGCADTDSINVISLLAPVNVNCSGGSYTLTCTQNFATYTWVGSSSVLGYSSSVTLTTPDYVQLAAYDASGCMYSNAIDLTAANALAGFTWSANTLSVQFNNTSSNAVSYNWNFGDSNTSTAANPVHAYTTPGTYTVALIAYGVCTNDTLTQVITVTPNGVTEQSSQEIFATPNPCYDRFTIHIPAGMEVYSIIICDNAGKQYNKEMSPSAPYTIDVTSWETQSYIVQLETSEGLRCFRMIVVH
jgi:PKD repeat protein